MKCDKETAGNVGNFLLPLLVQSFSLSNSFLYHWSDDHAMIIYEICRDKRNYTDSKSCFEVESATMQNHTVPKR